MLGVIGRAADRRRGLRGRQAALSAAARCALLSVCCRGRQAAARRMSRTYRRDQALAASY